MTYSLSIIPYGINGIKNYSHKTENHLVIFLRYQVYIWKDVKLQDPRTISLKEEERLIKKSRGDYSVLLVNLTKDIKIWESEFISKFKTKFDNTISLSSFTTTDTPLCNQYVFETVIFVTLAAISLITLILVTVFYQKKYIRPKKHILV